jgi:hypothetical protein
MRRWLHEIDWGAISASAAFLLFCVTILTLMAPQSITSNYSSAGDSCIEPAAFWQKTTCDPVAFFTLVLALFSALLVAVSSIQIHYLIRADTTARNAAIAAQREFVASHRPRIIARHFMLDPVLPDHKMHAFLAFVNRGDTKARIVAIGADIWFKQAGAWTEPLELKVKDTDQFRWLDSGEALPASCESRRIPTAQQIEDLKFGRIQAAVVGEIRYCDGNGVLRRTGFCRAYSPNEKFFRTSADPEEEYQD